MYIVKLPLACSTPINVEALRYFLAEHSDRDLVNFLVDGFSHGFDLMYEGPITTSNPKNLKSARDAPNAVQASIDRELARGHTAGPFLEPPFQKFHCSPIGAVPKTDNTYRLILDLSSPRGFSINDGIDPELVSVRYSRFDDAVDMVRELGPSCYMAKIDIQSAFRLCPVRPVDWPLLGYRWGDNYYFDTQLPFGCRSSPFIFNSFADAVLWILSTVVGVAFIVHYLDDYFLCNDTWAACKLDMSKVLETFSALGIPVAKDKLVGPANIITYLGIDINAEKQSISLSEDKFAKLLETLKAWQSRKKCTKRELLSLIGQLAFAAKVVKQGRFFLRRLIDLSTKVSSLNHHIDLNSEARADISWWLDLLPEWQGTNKIQAEVTTAASISLYTDASGSLGMGAVFGSEWLSCKWPQRFKEIDDINYKELFAIVAAVITWAEKLQNKQILLYTDNQNIANVWKKGYSLSKPIMKLVRNFFLFTARHNINILMNHIPGHFNRSADLLSRLQVNKFKALNPGANSIGSELPAMVWTF